MRNGFIRLTLRTAVLACVMMTGAAARAQTAADPFGVPGTPITFGTSFSFRSAQSADIRQINVLLPDGYDDPKTASRRYPVLYLLDGGTGWQDFVHIAAMAQQGGLWGANAPMIVVGIESHDRRAEFTRPSHDPAEQRDFPTHGQAEAFHRFVVDELKVAIALRFRTDGNDGLIGESLAGLFVVDEALRHGDSFRHFIAISPSLWWDHGLLSSQAEALLAAPGQPQRSLWLSMADEGGTMQGGMDRLIAALGKAGSHVTWRYVPMPNERHSTIYHLAATRAVREVFPADPPKP